jgi:hypothetical protein
MVFINVRRIALRPASELREILLIPSSFRWNATKHASLPHVRITYSTLVIAFQHQTSTAVLSSPYPCSPHQAPCTWWTGRLISAIGWFPANVNANHGTMSCLPHTLSLPHHRCKLFTHESRHQTDKYSCLLHYIYSALLLSPVAIRWTCIKDEPITLKQPLYFI